MAAPKTSPKDEAEAAAAAEAGETPPPVEPTPDEAEAAAEGEVVEPSPEEQAEIEDAAVDEAAQKAADKITSEALAIREHVTTDLSTMPSPREWDALRAFAVEICRTEFVPRDFKDRPEAVLAAMLTGREIGIGPMQSLRDISIIDGRPALAAHLQLAQLRKGGLKILESESTDKRAMIRAERRDTGEVATIEWTIEEAERAKDRKGRPLSDKDNWKNYPGDMLWARCVGRLTRRLGSDLVAGMPYTAEEIGDFDEVDGEGYETWSGAAVRGPLADRRDQGGVKVKVPTTWAEIAATFEPWGDQAKAEFGVFIGDAGELLFKERDRKKLPVDQEMILGQKASGAAVHFAENAPDPGGLPGYTRATMQAAWGEVLDGVQLPGPAWMMGPDETGRPTFEEMHAAGASSTTADTDETASPAPEGSAEGDGPSETPEGASEAGDATGTASERRAAGAAADDEIPFGGDAT